MTAEDTITRQRLGGLLLTASSGRVKSIWR